MVRVCNLCGSRETRLQYEIERFHIVRCIQCDLVYVAEEIGEDELVAYYGEAYYTGAQSQGYCDYIGRRKVRKDYFRSTIPMIRRCLAVDAPRVLDVGCAAGFFLEVAREQGWQARGVELSAYAAEYARSQLGLDVVTGTLAEAKFPFRSFDLITLWDVIEHLPNPSEVLTLVHDLLRPSGLVVISTGDISGATARLYGRRWGLLAPPGHLFYFSRRTLFAMLRKNAFEPLAWHSDGAFLLNDSGGTGEKGRGPQLPSLATKLHHNRWVNGVLRRLKLGSIMTVYARKCVTY
jgi:2-polyprenyl-3-methyl-5-hydroxy-6-metoxy-1,4-benzoquinol methylase